MRTLCHRVCVDLSSQALDATKGRLLARFGSRVEPWWKLLPEAVADLAERWDLVLGDAVGRGNTSLVIRCRRADGRSAMLKLAFDVELAAAEVSALRRWESSGRVPHVWGYDAARGALLLEAIASEDSLSERSTTVDVSEIALLIGDLHRSGAPVVADGVTSLATRVEFIFGYALERQAERGFAVEHIRRGRALALRLVADVHAPVLLHGDLHPANVLDGGPRRGLVAIDPRACVGDAAFDVVDWVFWGTGDPGAWESRSRHLAQTLDLSHERLWSWCAALAALLAASETAHGASAERVAALLALSP